MKTSSALLAALAAAPSALAHTVFTNFYVNGVDQGDAVAMRMRMDAASAGSPIPGITSNNLACNVGGDKGVARVQPVKDGSTLTFEFRSWPDDKSKQSLDAGHKGPCAVYLKKVDSAIDDPGHGDGWFKIWDDGYNAADKQWCTDKMIANNGHLSVVLPKGLKGGYYLARPELLALHNADKGDPQFYAGCAQIFLDSPGNLGPESTVSIPGYVKASDKALTWNIYQGDQSGYPVPGPSVAKLVSSGPTVASANGQSSQNEGQKPKDCILQNGNFCFKEVPSYTDEAGCWSANQDCWAQNEKCWKSTAPTGGSGCKIWENKCNDLEAACKSKNFNGPPNKGKDLTPKANTIDVGLVMPTSGVAASSPKTSAAKEETSAAAASTTAAAAKPSSADTKPTGAGYGSGTIPVQETPVATGSPKASEGGDNYGAPAASPSTTTVKPQTTVATSEIPFQTTPAPSCPEGFECVTVTTTVVTTAVQYVTEWVDMKRRSLHARRHVKWNL